MHNMDFFLGPCVLESEELALEIAKYLKENIEPLEGVNVFFKGSYDKANRTSVDSFRGPGLTEGLNILQKVKDTYGFPLITDFHDPDQAMPVAEVVDVLQIPAFLCRQTDMILAGAKACKKFGRKLKIKKGQFLSPSDTKQIVEKAATILDRDSILLTERGTSFGYNNLIVDMASFQVMKSFGVKTVHDATHCVQQPGGLGTITGGKRDQIFVLAKAAVAAGADAVFMECHPDPDKAKSDSTTCLQLEKLPEIVSTLVKLKMIVDK
ncbi:MAG: 3-deoxy-8-phosphooctulonate synthase [Bacteriovoracaceae bacterium]|jgi:2-dehydro-3-deoxyphosphooctonate aldolase (KDO 8-P synthase)|nr:3-deoxy-8-phosphooctulonate synthase [Bacteriovoracaceae bacterium]